MFLMPFIFVHHVATFLPQLQTHWIYYYFALIVALINLVMFIFLFNSCIVSDFPTNNINFML